MPCAPHISTPLWATLAFCLALTGFGAKAGLVPLHVWLPEAHPAAPSPVSALMSGVMLKIALYGMIRVSFDLLGQPVWWWGLLPLALGLFSALYGVVFAAAQTDMKRLLAYSSIENIGILFTGLGLAIVFAGRGHARGGGAHLDRRHVPRDESRVHEESAVSGHRRGVARHRRAQPRTPGRSHPSNALGCMADAGRRARHCRAAALERIRVGMAAAPVLSVRTQGAAPVHQHAAAARALRCSRWPPRSPAMSWSNSSASSFSGSRASPRSATAHDAGFAERLGLAWLALGCVLLGLFPTYVISLLQRGHPAARVGRVAGERRAVVAAACRFPSASPLTHRWCSSR